MPKMKECGSCNWCCYFPTGNGLTKGLNEWCKYVVPGVGCIIYDSRPKCCHYECVWKQDQYLEEEFRPDQCGVMFEIPHNSDTIHGFVDPDRPGAWETKRMRQLITKFIQAGYPVKIRKV